MSVLIREIEDFIFKEGLFTHSDKLLLAVSGGVDSVVLAHVLYRLNYDFSIAHCNFQLRGNASAQDERLVYELSELLNIQCYIKCFDTRAYAAQQGLSIQLAARALRYEWFGQLRTENHYTKLITAHHLNDSVETSIYNFIKGTGVNGLKGITAKGQQAVRPLIRFKKDDIIQYAKNEKLRWREDESNKENKYSRNLIRNEIIPLMETVNPGMMTTIQRNQKRFLGAYQLLTNEITRVRDSYVEKTNSGIIISKGGLSAYDKEAKSIILEGLLSPFAFNFDQVSACLDAWDNVGTQFLSASYRLTIDRDKLYVDKPDVSTVHLSIEKEGTYDTAYGELELKTIGAETITEIPLDPAVACLDYDKVKLPLVLRNWKQGDRFIPLGMRGKKKVSDFMIDIKIPLNLKSSVLVLEDAEGKIIWVVGYRIDNRCRFSVSTKRLIKLKWKTND